MKNKFFSLIIFIIQFTTLFAQDNFLRLNKDTISINDYSINYGFEKVVNTYFFRINGNYKSNFDFGGIEIMQNYLGTALKTNNTSFRDDENLIFKYFYPISNKFELFNQNDWFLSADAREIGLNKLEKIRSRIGSKYIFNNKSFLDISYGIEQNKQIGLKTYGQVFNTNGELRDYDIGGIILNSNIYADLLYLNDGRNYNAINMNIMFDKVYDNNNKMNFYVKYKNLNQDFLSKININDNNYSIENRNESRIMSYFNTDYIIFNSIASNFNINFNNAKITRSFDNLYQGNLFSGVERNLSELNFDIKSFFKYETNNFHQIFEFSYGFRDEENNVKNIRDISKSDFINLQNQENSKDNSSNITKLRIESYFKFNNSDELIANLYSSIFRYNTPSNLNNDDRDELSIFGNLGYIHKFSEIFLMNLKFEIQLNHLVFLKSQRSSLNNWNRVIILSPSFRYESKSFGYYPELEVLANYTVYDFEDKTPGIQSFSFRQLSYKDSMIVKIKGRNTIFNTLQIRWFERGILFWNNFSESPQNRNIEIFDKLMFYLKKSNSSNIGVGVRYYGIFQKNMSNNALSYSDIYQISVGPQTDISIEFDKWLFVRISGWYEFQKTNANPFYKGIANVLFESKILI